MQFLLENIPNGVQAKNTIEINSSKAQNKKNLKKQQRMAYGVRDTVKCDKVNNGYNNNKGLFRPANYIVLRFSSPFSFPRRKKKNIRKKKM